MSAGLLSLVDLLFLRYGVDTTGRCACPKCDTRRAKQLQGDLEQKFGGAQ